jgi:hypothetical protein
MNWFPAERMKLHASARKGEDCYNFRNQIRRRGRIPMPNPTPVLTFDSRSLARSAIDSYAACLILPVTAR